MSPSEFTAMMCQSALCSEALFDYSDGDGSIMPVLIEGISVLVKISTIRESFRGGLAGFCATIPNKTMCSDSELVRVGFMYPDDAEKYIELLEKCGLKYLENDEAKDITMADHVRGLLISSEWVEIGIIEVECNQNIMAARLTGSTKTEIAIPRGWRFDESLSKSFTFTLERNASATMRFLRHESNVDVYLNLVTGKQVYVGRTDRS